MGFLLPVLVLNYGFGFDLVAARRWEGKIWMVRRTGKPKVCNCFWGSNVSLHPCMTVQSCDVLTTLCTGINHMIPYKAPCSAYK